MGPQTDMIMRRMLPSASEVPAALRSLLRSDRSAKLFEDFGLALAPIYPKVEPSDPKVSMTPSYNGFTVGSRASVPEKGALVTELLCSMRRSSGGSSGTSG